MTYSSAFVNQFTGLFGFHGGAITTVDGIQLEDGLFYLATEIGDIIGQEI